MVMSLVWQVFEPLLFGLVGAEVSVEYMNTKVVGEFKYDIRADFKRPVTSRSYSLFKIMFWEFNQGGSPPWFNLQILIVNMV